MFDEIVTYARDSVTGCCPQGTTAGVRSTHLAYTSSMVICGFDGDGSALTLPWWSAVPWERPEGQETCNYGNCYVWHQNVPCSDGELQKLSGCCETDGVDTTPETCQLYGSPSITDQYGDAYKSCPQQARHEDGDPNWNKIGTETLEDDEEFGILWIEKKSVYVPCGPYLESTLFGGYALVMDDADFVDAAPQRVTQKLLTTAVVGAVVAAAAL